MADPTKDEHAISRRHLLGLSLGAVAAAGVPAAVAGHEAAEAEVEAEGLGARLGASTTRAYTFLDRMMDAYATGPTLRLIQSFTDQQGLMTTGFTYDNAQAILAYLVRGARRDVVRAQVLGDSLLYAQQHDPNFSDGRLRQAYFVGEADARGAFVKLALAPFFFVGSATGDMAWAGIALAQLHARTRSRRHLEGALRLGQWIVDHAHDTRGAGGYNFGVDGGNNPILTKSTEHNISAFGLFSLLAELTGDGAWSARAEHARQLVAALWNAEAGFFWTGTGPDGVTIVTENIPEDVQTWSYLAFRDPDFDAGLEWTKTNLAATDTPQTLNSRLRGNLRLHGVSFASISLRALAPSSPFDPPPAPAAVWMEGSAHLAAALLLRRRPRRRDLDGFDGDVATAERLLDQIRIAQDTLAPGQTVGGRPLPDGHGVVAASSVLNTGFGFSFYPNRHVGATAWYLTAAGRGNPFREGLRGGWRG